MWPLLADFGTDDSQVALSAQSDGDKDKENEAKEAGADFFGLDEYLQKINFNTPTYPVISNSDPSLCKNPSELKIKLINQMCNGVRWRETMDLMAKDTDLHIVEIGPSNVLSGLGKRHLNNIKISQVSSSEAVSYLSLIHI